MRINGLFFGDIFMTPQNYHSRQTFTLVLESPDDGFLFHFQELIIPHFLIEIFQNVRIIREKNT